MFPFFFSFFGTYAYRLGINCKLARREKIVTDQPENLHSRHFDLCVPHSCHSSIPHTRVQCAVSSAPIHNSQILFEYPALKRTRDWWCNRHADASFRKNTWRQLFRGGRNDAIRKWCRCLTSSVGLGIENSICLEQLSPWRRTKKRGLYAWGTGVDLTPKKSSDRSVSGQHLLKWTFGEFHERRTLKGIHLRRSSYKFIVTITRKKL